MLRKLISHFRLKRCLKSDGTKASVNFVVIINNDDIKEFPSYDSALQYIDKYRNTNQVFNLCVYRAEFFSLISDLNSL